MPSADVLLIAVASLVGNALVVWGVVRHELHTMRGRIEEAHDDLASIRAKLGIA